MHTGLKFCRHWVSAGVVIAALCGGVARSEARAATAGDRVQLAPGVPVPPPGHPRLYLLPAIAIAQRFHIGHYFLS